MRESLKIGMCVALALALVLAIASSAGARRGKHPTGLAEILMHMNEASRNLKTVSANLDQTSVTVLVDDKSTQSGQFFFRNGKPPDICIKFQKPEQKIFLLKKNEGYMFMPKINQIQEFKLAQKRDLVQQFLLLGFGADTGELKKNYDISYLQEEDLGGESTVKLELKPLKPGVAAQFTKIELWISEDSWLPVQQQFTQPSKNYLIAHYSHVEVNRPLDKSAFELNAPANAQHVPMNF